MKSSLALLGVLFTIGAVDAQAPVGIERVRMAAGMLGGFHAGAHSGRAADRI